MKKEKLDHKCVICGTMYHSCDNCQQIKTYTPWRSLCDTFDHYQVWLSIRSYQDGLDSLEETIANLERAGVNKKSYADWPQGVKDILDGIFAQATQKKPARKTEKTELETPKTDVMKNAESEE
ncbi:hypothetical protein M2140_000150 [Clostridiales Family XIII bacterium PM5-7]